MSKERYNQIIDDVYKNYKSLTHNKNEKNGNYGDYSKLVDNPLISGVQHLTKDSFIQMIKIDSEFSENWGLKIEERELTDKERLNTLIQNDQRLIYEKVQSFKNLGRKTIKSCLDEKNIPTRIITIKYKNETIECYE